MAQESEQSLPTTWQIARSIGPLIPYSVLFAFAISVSAPTAIYVGLDFFAQKYTTLPPDQIRCESSMLSPHCRKAVFDSNRMTMVLSVVSPIVQFMILPAAGVISDACGRRRVLAVNHVLATLPGLAALSFLFFNTSMYWYYTLVPLTMNPVTNLSWGTVIAYSVVTDCVENPDARSAGLGLLEALMAAAALFGNLVGMCLSVDVAMSVTMALCIVNLLYLLFFLPETLPPEKRTRVVTWRSLMPGVELRILGRTPALRLLSFLLMLTGFLSAGFARIIPTYLQWTMNWTARDNYVSNMLTSVSTVICLGLMFRPLVAMVGDVGVLFVSCTVGMLGRAATICATRRWQVQLITFMDFGPAGFALPAVAGLKSRMVGPDDQGAMQGALNTILNVASSIGVFAFGAMFDATNWRLREAATEAPQHVGMNRTAFIVCIVLTLPALWLTSRVPGALAVSEPAGPAKPDGCLAGPGDKLGTASGTEASNTVPGYGSMA
mmetsp:Transcript_132242/g.411045  ORF Transcript_132242/g.411045 Transcript_132242/m.411045 type:complete len:493 (+) Transcript_132242:63-1541(+)